MGGERGELTVKPTEGPSSDPQEWSVKQNEKGPALGPSMLLA